MRYPEIREAVFDPSCDKAGNSALLRAILDSIVCVSFDRLINEFSATKWWEWWNIRIEDKHDDEDKPHYILEIGEGNHRGHKSKRFSTKYCDYHSTDNGEIVTAPGEFIVQIWIDDDDSRQNTFGKRVSEAYLKAMQETLPDYFVLAEEEPFELDSE